MRHPDTRPVRSIIHIGGTAVMVTGPPPAARGTRQPTTPDETTEHDQPTEYARKAHAVGDGDSAGVPHRGLGDPRERILAAARQLERGPYGKPAVDPDGDGEGHEYLTSR